MGEKLSLVSQLLRANPNNPRSIGCRVSFFYIIFTLINLILLERILIWSGFSFAKSVSLLIVETMVILLLSAILLYNVVCRYARSICEVNQERKAVADEKVRALLMLDSIAACSTDCIFTKDINGCYQFFNKAAEVITGRPRDKVLGMSDQDLFPGMDVSLVKANDERALKSNTSITVIERFHTIEGERTFWVTKGPLRDHKGDVVGIFGISRDVTDLRNKDARIRESEERLSQMSTMAGIGAWEYDIETGLIHGTVATAAIHELESMNGIPFTAITDRYTGISSEKLKAALKDAVGLGRGYELELELVTPKGTCKWVRVAGYPLSDKGIVRRIHGFIQDVTTIKHSEARIYNLANFDGLTGLPNRALIMDRLGQLLAQSMRDHAVGAFLLINIDRFKTINDARGLGDGDNLLRAFAARLSDAFREGDTLSRLAADEFAVLLPNLGSTTHVASHHASLVANKLHSLLQEPFLLGGEEIVVSASIGITLFPEKLQDDPEWVVRRADTALHKLKKQGGNHTLFFDSDMSQFAEEYFQLERELRKGIVNNELQLYLQSQVDHDGRVIGAEALVRWIHPERGMVSPATFIPIAEESDLIVSIDGWVFTRVCELIAQPHMSSLRIAVNISPRHFRRSDFVGWVKDIVQKTQTNAHNITLEITEGLLVDNIADAIEKMRELSLLGISFSIDDFGTGYSSLSYLKRLPIHELKIDKMFVQEASVNADDAALVDSILAVARHFDLKVVAEGVETREQADFLRQRCSITYQGFLYGRPQPVEQWVEGWQAERLAHSL